MTRRHTPAAVLLTAALLCLPCRAAGEVADGSADEEEEAGRFGSQVLECAVTEPDDGVRMEERVVLCADRETRRLLYLFADTARCTVTVALPGDAAAIDGGTGASLGEMAEACEEKGGRVLAAVNGDFYKTGSDGGAEYAPFAPLGVVIKDGLSVSEGQRAEGAAFFGMTADGMPVIGSAEPGGEWDSVKAELQTAVGGELWLVKDGRGNSADLTWRVDSPTLSARYGPAGRGDAGEGLSSYPRTAVGYREDGTVVVLVASPGYETAGLTVPQLAALMLEEGCVQAMNLDGGPSSQLWVRGEDGLKNVTARGTSGKIGNGLLFLIGTPGEAEGAGEAAEAAANGGGSWLVWLPTVLVFAAAAYLWLFKKPKQGKHQ